tara:strand:+ start:1802 stop:2995 length:1194 start_codon:yes stop_codon:yes gene_type:complete
MRKKIVAGVSLGTSSSHTRYGDRDDVVVISLEAGSKVSCKFTSNRFKAAPVKHAIKNLKSINKGKKFFLVNAGNANAGNGKKGEKNVMDYCSYFSKISSSDLTNVLPFSTGVIGEDLDLQSHKLAFEKAFLNKKSSNWNKASKAILTTDTKPKLLSKAIKVGKKEINLIGFAKGSGMIGPDFATLLSFVFTDAEMNQSLLDKIHSDSLEHSFNAITVDGDTSPNDSSCLVATGGSGVKINRSSRLEKTLSREIRKLFEELAKLLIIDAEGATKLIRVNVHNAINKNQAKEVAFTVALSPLVKTAMFGNDANWGRILAAIGRCKSIEDISKTSIKINHIPMVNKGSKSKKHSEKDASKAVRKKNITIDIDLGLGKKTHTVNTSDFSEDYVLINSEYRS